MLRDVSKREKILSPTYLVLVLHIYTSTIYYIYNEATLHNDL